MSPYRLLLAWLLGLGEHVLPIPGATRAGSIVDSLGATGLVLDPEDHRRIGAIGCVG